MVARASRAEDFPNGGDNLDRIGRRYPSHRSVVTTPHGGSGHTVSSAVIGRAAARAGRGQELDGAAPPAM